MVTEIVDSDEEGVCKNWGDVELDRAVQYGKTEPYRTEIDNIVWIWYIPYKPNEYDF